MGVVSIFGRALNPLKMSLDLLCRGKVIMHNLTADEKIISWGGGNMYKPWHYLSVLVGVILVVAAPAWADYQAEVEAFTRGDYNTALRVFHPLAEGGHAEAQAMLGNIYTPGLGVPHDNHQAAKWYRLAAEQGLARAQLNLGLMYSKGQGVSKDNVLAHMWLTLAGAQGNAYARRAQNAVEKLMGNRNDKRPFCLDRNVPKNSVRDQSADSSHCITLQLPKQGFFASAFTCPVPGPLARFPKACAATSNALVD